MSKTNSEMSLYTLLQKRQLYTDVFRSEEKDIENFIKIRFSKSFNPVLLKNFWEIGQAVLGEILHQRNLTKAENLLHLFSKYPEIYSPEVEQGFEKVLQKYGCYFTEEPTVATFEEKGMDQIPEAPTVATDIICYYQNTYSEEAMVEAAGEGAMEVC